MSEKLFEVALRLTILQDALTAARSDYHADPHPFIIEEPEAAYEVQKARERAIVELCDIIWSMRPDSVKACIESLAALVPEGRPLTEAIMASDLFGEAA
jgi:hypothetical protein